MRLLVLGTTLLLAAGTGAAQAAAPTPPPANHAVACTLGGGIALAIKVALAAVNASQGLGLKGDVGSLSVDSIVIRSAENPNGGQLRAGSPVSYSGAIVCTFGEGLLPPAVQYTIAPTGASTPITGVDLLATQTDTFLQLKKPAVGKKTENLMCLNTDANNDCFNIFRKGVAR